MQLSVVSNQCMAGGTIKIARYGQFIDLYRSLPYALRRSFAQWPSRHNNTPSVIAGVGHLRPPRSLIAKMIVGVGRRDLSRLLVAEVIGGRCLARLLMPKRIEKILWGRRVLL